MGNQKTRMIGPSYPGIVKPRRCKIGIMSEYTHKPERVGDYPDFKEESVCDGPDIGSGVSNACSIQQMTDAEIGIWFSWSCSHVEPIVVVVC